MTKQIVDDLRMSLQVSEFTGCQADSRIVQAFRAKEFGRCPKCDERALVSWVDFRHTLTVRCNKCETSTTLDFMEIERAWNDEGFSIDDSIALLVVDRFNEITKTE